MYDPLLKGGTIVDAASGLDGVLDVAIENGKIARIAAGIVAGEAARVIEVGGKLVTPGLIDCCAHVFEGVSRTGVNPDLAGVYAGVTTIVDAGSAGAATFDAFPRHIIPRCHTEIVPFLRSCQTGLATNPANAIGVEHRLGRLEVGRQADVSVLELRQGDWMVYDILGSGLSVDRAFLPHLTVKRGTVFAPDFGPRPWGWEPDRVLSKGSTAGCCC